MRREQWFVWLTAIIIFILVLAAVGYLAGWWTELSVSAAL
jgi:hypothetical protein